MTKFEKPILKELSRSSARYLGLVSIAAAAMSLTSCSLMTWIVEESVIGTTGRFGSESFTLVGELPANFKMDIWASYGPIKNGSLCEYYDVLAERTETRGFGTPLKDEYQANAHTATFEIPLTYSVGLCAMKLGEVTLTIGGRYGDRKDQTSSGRGGFYVVKNLPTGALVVDDADEIKMNSTCEWSFQQRQRSSPPGELEKLLDCRSNEIFLLHDKLADKTVRIHFDLDQNEQPSMKNRWIKRTKLEALPWHRKIPTLPDAPDLQNIFNEWSNLHGLS